MPDGRLIDANSIVEWRLSPGRLNKELDRFLDEVWDSPSADAAEEPPRSVNEQARASRRRELVFPA